MFKQKPIQAPIEITTSNKGAPKPGALNFNTGTEVAAAKKAFETDLASMSDKITSAFGKVDLPKSVTAANDLNMQIDAFVKKAEAAGLKTTAWTDELKTLHDRVEGLKQAGLAKEAVTFARAVDEDAIAVKRFAAGSLDPLNEHLTTIDQAYEALRLKIEASIEDNRELAKVNDAAAASMGRLESQLTDLEDAHSRAREAAVLQWQAEQKLADIQMKREIVGAQEALADLHNARGDAGPMTKLDRQREGIARDLEEKALAAQEKLAQLEADRAQAELVGDTAQIERLSNQIILQQQLSDLIDKTTVDQITAQERLQEAFDALADGLSDAIGTLLTEWKIDAGDLKNVLKQVVQSLFVKPVQDAAAGWLKMGVGALTSWATGAITGGGFATVDASGTWTPGPQGFPENAAGGFVPPGKWEVAGEAGPELLFGGKRGISVFSNADSRKMAGGDRGAVNQVFNIYTPDADSFRRSRRQVQREAKLGLV